jgi:CRP/FNR family transcriptional regulator, cyclic AMP receptor protein
LLVQWGRFGRARYCQRVRLRRDAKLELLKGVPLFAKCSKAELRRIAMLADEVEFGENKAVIREGTRGREFFVVVEGVLRVTRNGRKVSDLGAGDFVGELALVADVPRTATVTASTSVHLLVLTHRGFRELLNQSPSIAAKVLESLGERLHSDASRNTSRPVTI